MWAGLGPAPSEASPSCLSDAFAHACPSLCSCGAPTWDAVLYPIFSLSKYLAKIEPMLGPTAGLTGEMPSQAWVPRSSGRQRESETWRVRVSLRPARRPPAVRALPRPLLARLASPLRVRFLICETALGGDGLRWLHENQADAWKSCPEKGGGSPKLHAALILQAWPACPTATPTPALAVSVPLSPPVGLQRPHARDGEPRDLSRPGLSLSPAQRSSLSAPSA